MVSLVLGLAATALGLGVGIWLNVWPPQSIAAKRCWGVVSITFIASGILSIFILPFLPKGRQYVGILNVHRTFWERLLRHCPPLSPLASRTVCIGDSGACFGEPANPPIHEFFRGLDLTLEQNDDDLIVSSSIHDSNGAAVVVIDHGEWKVASDTGQSWDFNYRDDALEVKNGANRIVLQIQLFPDRVRLQGESWVSEHGIRLIESPDPNKPGAFFVFLSRSKNPDEPEIKPLFRYPSQHHLGEFVSDPQPDPTNSVMFFAVIIYASLILVSPTILLALRFFESS